jgi:hypothetical protein
MFPEFFKVSGYAPWDVKLSRQSAGRGEKPGLTAVTMAFL